MNIVTVYGFHANPLTVNIKDLYYQTGFREAPSGKTVFLCLTKEASFSAPYIAMVTTHLRWTDYVSR